MKKLSLVGTAGVLALALAGCSVSVTSNSSTAAEPANAAEPAPAADDNASGDTNADADAPTGQDFNILNKTGHIVTEINVSPSDQDKWGANLLGKDVMRDGESGKVTIAHEQTDCKWDVRAKYDDGDSSELKEVDLCTVSTITLNP